METTKELIAKGVNLKGETIEFKVIDGKLDCSGNK